MHAVALPPPEPSRPQLTEVVHRAGEHLTTLARDLGVDVRSVARWAAGTCLPQPRVRAALADWLALRGFTLADAFGASVMAEIHPFPSERPAHAGAPPSTPPSSEEPDMEITHLEPLTGSLLKHFGLTADPFEGPDDPDDIWRSPTLVRLEAILEAGLRRRQIVALVGDAGAGKSTLIRRLCGRSAGQRTIRVIAPASLDRSKIEASALSVAIIRDLTGRNTAAMASEPRAELLRTTLAEQRELGVFPVLVIDEAHLLSNRALVAIKQIWDSHLSHQQLAVIMVGQPPLKERLKRDPSLKEVTGRTAIVEIPRLGKDAASYLEWRFSRVGTKKAAEVFTPEAIRKLADKAEYPLWLNNLAARAMLVAASVGDTVVNDAHVGKA